MSPIDGARTLWVEDLVVAHGGRPIVEVPRLRVEAGTVLAVTAPSGTGKTSLLRVLAGLDPAAAGTVVAPHGPLGVVFQQPGLLPWRSALDNVLFGLGRRPTATERTRARTELAELGLGDRGEDRPSRLSGGMQQRVALARAVMVNPALLLADEPLAHLDRGWQLTVARRLRRAADDGAVVVVAMHDGDEAAKVADRVGRLEGRPARWSEGGIVNAVLEHDGGSRR